MEQEGVGSFSCVIGILGLRLDRTCSRKRQAEPLLYPLVREQWTAGPPGPWREDTELGDVHRRRVDFLTLGRDEGQIDGTIIARNHLRAAVGCESTVRGRGGGGFVVLIFPCDERGGRKGTISTGSTVWRTNWSLHRMGFSIIIHDTDYLDARFKLGLVLFARKLNIKEEEDEERVVGETAICLRVHVPQGRRGTKCATKHGT